MTPLTCRTITTRKTTLALTTTMALLLSGTALGAQSASDTWERLMETTRSLNLDVHVAQQTDSGTTLDMTGVVMTPQGQNAEEIAIVFDKMIVHGASATSPGHIEIPGQMMIMSQAQDPVMINLTEARLGLHTGPHSQTGWRFTARGVESFIEDENLILRAQDPSLDFLEGQTTFSMSYAHQGFQAIDTFTGTDSPVALLEMGPTSFTFNAENVVFDETIMNSLSRNGTLSWSFEHNGMVMRGEENGHLWEHSVTSSTGGLVIDRTGVNLEGRNSDARFRETSNGEISVTAGPQTMSLNIPLFPAPTPQTARMAYQAQDITITGLETELHAMYVDNADTVAAYLQGPWSVDVNMEAAVRILSTLWESQTPEEQLLLQSGNMGLVVRSTNNPFKLEVNGNIAWPENTSLARLETATPTMMSVVIDIDDLQNVLNLLPQEQAIMAGMMAMTFGERQGNSVRYTLSMTNGALRINGMPLPF